MSEQKLHPLPILIVKTGTMKKADILRAQKYGLVLVIESDEPSSVRFVEPPPMRNVEEKAAAALSLMRVILREPPKDYARATLAKMWADFLINDSRPENVQRVKP